MSATCGPRMPGVLRGVIGERNFAGLERGEARNDQFG